MPLHDEKDMARKEFSLLHKQNMHNSPAQEKVASGGYLHEFATLVLHPTVNYGPFNFTIMANGGGDAENSRFSRPHSGKSGGEKQCKTAPTCCLQLRQLLWVPFGRSGGNQGCPGAWSLGNETAGEKSYYYDGRQVF